MKPLLFALAVVVLACLAIAWRLSSSDSTREASHSSSSAPIKATPSESTKPATAKSTATAPSATTPQMVVTTDPSLEIQRQCKAVLDMTNATQRMAAFNKLLASTTDIAGIKAILQTLNDMFKSGRIFHSELNAFWHAIASRDRPLAMALIESHGAQEKWHEQAVSVLVQEWASTDPQAAMQWLDANQSLSGQALDSATLNLIYGYASHNLKAATAYTLKAVTQDDPIFGEAAYVLTRQALQQGGTAGLFSWFEALPSNELKQRLFNSISRRLAEIDPAQQRVWLDSQVSKPYRYDNSYRDYIGEWAKTDPRAAMDYAVKLPRSPQNGTYVGLAYAAYEWLVIDPAAFTAYFHTLPPGDLRTGMINAIKQPLSDKNFPSRKREPAMKFLEGVR